MHIVTASIVLYNNALEQIRECVASLQADYPVQVFLIDNSNQKGGYAALASDTVQIIDSPGNIGFGRGHNLALVPIERVGSVVHLVVNPDIVVTRGSTKVMIDYIVGHDSVVLVGPKIMSPEGDLYRSCKLLPTPWNLFARRFMPSYLYEAADAKYELRAFRYDRLLEVNCLSGAFLAFRSKTFLAINGFDPRYFMYLEDVDICRRAGSQGSLVFLPQASVIHEHGQGSYRSFRLLKEHVRSAVLYFVRFGWWRDLERDRLNQAVLARIAGNHTHTSSRA